MALKTLIIKPGGKVEIRAIATAVKGGEQWSCATQEFLQNIGTSLPAELTKISLLLEEFSKRGMIHNQQKFKKLPGTNDLFEFKTTKIRLLCFWDKGGLVICTHGFVKKAQKTDRKEISRAQRLKDQYFNEKSQGTLKHD